MSADWQVGDVAEALQDMDRCSNGFVASKDGRYLVTALCLGDSLTGDVQDEPCLALAGMPLTECYPCSYFRKVTPPEIEKSVTRSQLVDA